MSMPVAIPGSLGDPSVWTLQEPSHHVAQPQQVECNGYRAGIDAPQPGDPVIGRVGFVRHALRTRVMAGRAIFPISRSL